MPIQNNPPRQIGTAVQRSQNDQYAVERGEGAFNGITEENVTAINPDGSYQVVNEWLTTSGVSQPIQVGDIVKVGWHGGKPVVILSHTARRAKFVPPAQAGGPIVEMLLAAPTATPSSISHSTDALDVYFRNASQLTLLKCRDQIIAAGFTISLGSFFLVPNSWGLDQRHFMVQFSDQVSTHLIIAIFRLIGDNKTPLTGAAKATLTSTIDLTASLIPLGTVSWDENVLGGSHVTTAITLGGAFAGYTISVAGPIIVQTVAASIQNAVLTKAGHLILAINVLIINRPAGGAVTAAFFYPYLIDVTAGTVLFNGIAQQGAWPTTIYNGAAFVASGPGFFDNTITGTNAWIGGAQFYMVPSAKGNFQRLFIGLLAFYFGGNPSLAGLVQQALFARDLSISPTLFTISPLTQYPSGEGSHFWLASSDQRYVMWARQTSPPPFGVSNPSAFLPPLSSTLTGYSFNEGLRITDLGATEAIEITNYTPLTLSADIRSFLDQVPYLTSTALMWEDHNDLRVSVDPSSRAPSGRVAPEFVSFRSSNTSGFIVTVPFVLPLRRFSTIRQDVATLQAIPASKKFITDMVNFEYLNSGHADMVTGYENFASPNGLFVCVQVINGPGVTLPNK